MATRPSAPSSPAGLYPAGRRLIRRWPSRRSRRRALLLRHHVAVDGSGTSPGSPVRGFIGPSSGSRRTGRPRQPLVGPLTGARWSWPGRIDIGWSRRGLALVRRGGPRPTASSGLRVIPFGRPFLGRDDGAAPGLRGCVEPARFLQCVAAGEPRPDPFPTSRAQPLASSKGRDNEFDRASEASPVPGTTTRAPRDVRRCSPGAPVTATASTCSPRCSKYGIVADRT